VSLYLGLGSNLGNRKNYLKQAINKLSATFEIIDKSNIYESKAILYLNQPDFLNMVIECKTPCITPNEVLKVINKIENELGRKRDILKGPRTCDIDILFFNNREINSKDLKIPHPFATQRSFVVLPLKELKSFKELNKIYNFHESFSVEANPIGRLDMGEEND